MGRCARLLPAHPEAKYFHLGPIPRPDAGHAQRKRSRRESARRGGCRSGVLKSLTCNTSVCKATSSAESESITTSIRLSLKLRRALNSRRKGRSGARDGSSPKPWGTTWSTMRDPTLAAECRRYSPEIAARQDADDWASGTRIRTKGNKTRGHRSLCDRGRLTGNQAPAPGQFNPTC